MLFVECLVRFTESIVAIFWNRITAEIQRSRYPQIFTVTKDDFMGFESGEFGMMTISAMEKFMNIEHDKALMKCARNAVKRSVR